MLDKTYNYDVFILTDENGNQIYCDMLDELSFRGTNYKLFIQVEGRADILVLAEREENIFVSVDDAVLLAQVREIFARRNAGFG